MLGETARNELLADALRAGQVVRLRAMSASMAPLIRVGDLLLVRRESVELGDVALVPHRGKWVAHRVIAGGQATWTLRGDVLGAQTHDVPRDELLGRVIAVQRGASAYFWRLWRRL